jgi:hypothetical protein
MERIELFWKLFPPMVCVGLVVAAIGSVGIARTPPPGSTGPVAVFAMVGAGLWCLAYAVFWLLIVSDAKGETVTDMVKPLVMIMIIGAALLNIMLPLAIHGALRRAGHPGVQVMAIMTIVLAGFAALWMTYLVLGEPEWESLQSKPWRGFLVTDLPVIARNVMLFVTAVLGMNALKRIPQPR